MFFSYQLEKMFTLFFREWIHVLFDCLVTPINFFLISSCPSTLVCFICLLLSFKSIMNQNLYIYLYNIWNIIFILVLWKKSYDITLPAKFCIVKAMFFSVVMYGCECGLQSKLSTKILMLLNCCVGEDSWDSLGQQGDAASPS